MIKQVLARKKTKGVEGVLLVDCVEEVTKSKIRLWLVVVYVLLLMLLYISVLFWKS